MSKDVYLKRSTRQESQTYNFKIFENTSNKSVSYEQNKFYYWFKSQVVVCTQGASSGQLLHGLFESFYDNKQLSIRGVFNKGLKHGNWTYWNIDGIIIRTESWDYGVKRGEEKYFDDEGKWLETIDYGFRSVVRTTHDSIIITNKEGVRQKVQLLDSIGNVKQTLKYKEGFPVERQKIKDKRQKTSDKRQETKEESKKRKVEREKEAHGTRQKTSEDKGKTKDKKQKTSEKKPKNSDVNQQNESSFWKRLFSKKKKENSPQKSPKKFSWKFWKKEISTKK